MHKSLLNRSVILDLITMQTESKTTLSYDLNTYTLTHLATEADIICFQDLGFNRAINIIYLTANVHILEAYHTGSNLDVDTLWLI